MLKIQKDHNETLDTRLKMSGKKMGILDLKIKNYDQQIMESSESFDLNTISEDKYTFDNLE